jgi:hypothetical protein
MTETKTAHVCVTLPQGFPSYFGVGSNPPDAAYRAVAVTLPDRPHETLYYEFPTTLQAEREAARLKRLLAGATDAVAVLEAWERGA